MTPSACPEDISALIHEYADSCYQHKSSMSELLRALQEAIGALAKDTERLNWLTERLFSLDTTYGEPPICVITFEWPRSARIGVDLRGSIDEARK